MAAKRKIGSWQVAPIGFGAMGLSHAYGVPPSDAEAERLLHHALDVGYDFIDTASIYGQGHNESLIGRALKDRRDRFILASKCGIVVAPDGSRGIDCRPAAVAQVLDDSLRRLGVDHIDLYYLHRRDFTVPVEESVAVLADAVKAGKIGAIGLSEVSAETLRRAHAVHRITALQTEYSLWTRNPEIAVLAACRELGTTFVAFSPVARGFLADALHDPAALPKGDIRLGMPRFQEPHFAANLVLLDGFRAIAAEIGCTAGQLALAWVAQIDPTIVSIPGTTSIAHLEENFAAADLILPDEAMARLDALINQRTVAGPRYSERMQQDIDTEEFARAS